MSSGGNRPPPPFADNPVLIERPASVDAPGLVDGTAHRLEDARRRAARLPAVDDALVVELIGLGFTWDGPGPSITSLFRTFARERVESNLAELKRRRGGSLIGPGSVLGACREDWAATSPAASSHAPTVAPAVAPAVALARAPIHTGILYSRSEYRNTTTSGPIRSGGGGENATELGGEGPSFALLAGIWHLPLRRQLSHNPPDVIQAAIDVALGIAQAKGAKGDDAKAQSWRFVAFAVTSGQAAELARTRREAAEKRAASLAAKFTVDAAEKARREAQDIEARRWSEYVATLPEPALREAARRGLGELSSYEAKWLHGALRSESADSLAQLRTRIVRRPDVFAAILGVHAHAANREAVAHAS